MDLALVNLTSTVDADIIVMTHYPSMEKMFAHRALKLLDGLGFQCFEVYAMTCS